SRSTAGGGADIANILQFEADFPGVKVVRLEQNYRSSKAVLRVADQLIQCNLKRKPKALFTENEEGRPVRLVQYATQVAEARDIAEQVAQQVAGGSRRPRDFAVFYRVNALSRSLERAFRDAGVPYQMVRGLEFYQRKEIKDVLAYCQLINNPRDDQAVLRTINTPPRGIGKKTVERLYEHAYVHGLTLFESACDAPRNESLGARPTKKVEHFAALVSRLAEFAGGDVEEIIGAILTESGYREHLAASESDEDAARLENIEELLTDARQFDERNPGGGQLELYLENAWLANETDDWEDQSDKVTMMTLHAAKGLEFPAVYLIAVEHGLLPHERSMEDADQLEEERRLAFVGITRAKEELQLSYATQRDFRGQRRRTVPSSFLLEMPREEMEMRQVGDGYPGDWDLPEAGYGEEGDAPQFTASSGEVASAMGEGYVAGSAGSDEGAASSRQDWMRAGSPLKTAAEMVGDDNAAPVKVSPDAFSHGMTVVHPEHGPGKIVALSGAGKQRRATVKFATAGERKFVLMHSALRPAERRGRKAP
ncbi:MAG: 3'-5' exonuclease, partial [Planctomycetota bacterium]